MKIGYARVSTEDQNPDLQLTALKKAGCQRVFADKATRAHVKRPELTKCLKTLAHGDTLVVWKLDHLGRLLRDLIGWLIKPVKPVDFPITCSRAGLSARCFPPRLTPRRFPNTRWANTRTSGRSVHQHGYSVNFTLLGKPPAFPVNTYYSFPIQIVEYLNTGQSY